MPLVRFQVRNEYGLGAEEMYRRVSDEDPKGILEGVTVAGLVGILRQLGDLAEFASEVFHDLQEEVMTTAARSHKMIARVQHLEASIPPIEKAVLAQRSHIHFAYTDGSEWHPKIQTRRNHLVYSYLPRFIMDTYEECRDPPDFHVLDKFDKGGSGSCLRRYSDPLFFKTALASSEMITGEKVQREKKARKSRNGQKKGLRQRNGEVLYGVSASGRIQFASPTSNGESSAAESNSTFNMRSKSELGHRSRSFDPRVLELRSTSLDLRTKLGYHEYVFDGGSSIQHEDQEDDQLSTPRSNLQTDGTGSIFLDERENSEYDDLSNRSLVEPIVRKSSSVTWDEKTEIMKPMYQQLDTFPSNEGQESKVLPLSSNLSKLENGAPKPVATLSDFGNIMGSVFYDNDSDELESEADSYVDALNTMESEVETDVECHTKKEVEPSSAKLKNEGTKEFETGPTRESNAQTSESSDVEAHTASYTSPKKQISQNLSHSVSSEDLIHTQPPLVNGISSEPYIVSVDTDRGSTDPVYVSTEKIFDSARNDPSFSSSNIPNSQVAVEKIVDQFGEESEEFPAKVADAPSVTFWTNGGLLGLQPSKPTDCSVTNIENNLTAGTKDDKCPLSSETVFLKSHTNGLDVLLKTPEQKNKNINFVGGNDGLLNNRSLNDLNIMQNVYSSTSSKPFRNKLEDDLSKKNSESVANIEKSGDSHNSSSINNVAQGHELKEPSTSKIGLLKLQDHHIMQEGRNRVADQTYPDPKPNNQIDHRSPVNSASSSPPLEHMKISVYPMNISETSVLQLKFPDGHHFCESNKGFMFPSFQLLPELSTSLQGIGYESDDDTFYRSSPDMSEEHMSQCSDSNSEQWESEETPINSTKDPTVYDALHRVSSDESISIPSEHDEKIADEDSIYYPDRNPNTWNSIMSLQDGPVLDFLSFDALNQLTGKQESKVDSDLKEDLDLVSQYPKIPTPLPPSDEPTPPPPPLPPLGWRLMKPKFAVEDNEQVSVSKTISNFNNLQISGGSPVQQLKAAQPEQPHIEGATSSPPYIKEQQILSRSITMQASNSKDLNEREDLLHQIRSKSFSLRRTTTTTRPTPITGPTSNTKVAAMLEKANAIRQAFVGSDDGEDENWSES